MTTAFAVTLPVELRTNPLERELATFARLLPDLLVEAKGLWALVKDDQFLGTFPSQDEAIAAGYEQVGVNIPFLTREIRSNDPAIYMNRDFCIGAFGLD